MIYPNEKNEFALRNVEEEIEYLNRNFKEDANYKSVTHIRNGETTENFPIRIKNRGTEETRYIKKYFNDKPDTPMQYGDIIQYGNESYIVTDIRDGNEINQGGIVTKVNMSLIWRAGTVFSTLGYVNMSNTKRMSTGDIEVLKGDITVYVPLTDDVKNIYINQRFLIGDTFTQPYKITGIDGTSKKGLVVITMEINSKDARDDYDNLIAYNGEKSEVEGIRIDSIFDSSYYLVNEDELYIKKYQFDTFTIKHYDSNDLEIATTFAYNVIGFAVDEYTVTETTNTEIVIENNNGLGEGILEITDTATSEVIDIDLILKGAI